MIVSDLVETTGDVVTTKSDDSLGHAAHLMKDHHVSGVPVVDETGRLVGIISVGQILHFAQDERIPGRLLDPEWHSPIITRPAKGEWEKRKVADAMISDVVTVRRSMSCQLAAQTLLNAGVHRAVVVDDDRRPVSMLTSFDFTRLVAFGGEASHASNDAGGD